MPCRVAVAGQVRSPTRLTLRDAGARLKVVDNRGGDGGEAVLQPGGGSRRHRGEHRHSPGNDRERTSVA
ncbi:MAG TPA: hypothetical protein VKA54_16345, partial [Gemmatimonadaceae bacterium]|nr:hypothetical protein [Gemmatimonadaceae bacterium]